MIKCTAIGQFNNSKAGSDCVMRAPEVVRWQQGLGACGKIELAGTSELAGKSELAEQEITFVLVL